MKRIARFILLIVFLVINLPGRCACAEYTVSVVFSSGNRAYRQAWRGFQEYANERSDDLEAIVYNITSDDTSMIYSEIIRKKPDIIVTLGTKASVLTRRNIKDIPIVFCMVLNPREIADGCNITGVSIEIPAHVKIRGIKQIIPEAENVGLIYSQNSVGKYGEIAESCKRMNLNLIHKKIDSAKKFRETLIDISSEIDCFLMVTDSKIYFPSSIKFLLLESLRKKVTVIGLSAQYTKAGALFAFECDYGDLGKQAAEIAVRILARDSCKVIAPVAPRKSLFTINAVVAKRLGISIPAEVMKEAKEVYGK